MSQSYSPTSPMKRTNGGEFQPDRPTCRAAFKTSVTTVPGTSNAPESDTPDTLVSGTVNTPVSGTSDTSIPDTLDTTVPGIFNTLVHEEPSHPSLSSPNTQTIPVKFFTESIQRKGREFFLPSSEGDTIGDRLEPTSSQSTARSKSKRSFARCGKPFFQQYSSREPSYDQSFYGLSGLEVNKSSCNEVSYLDKENEDPEASRPNRKFKGPEVHPQLMPDTESVEPLRSSSIYCPFPQGYQPNRQEHHDRVGDNMPLENRPPFPGPNMQSQQGSNSILLDELKAIRNHNVSLGACASSFRQRFMEESREWPERLFYQQEAISLEKKIYNNHILFLSYCRQMDGEKNF